MYMGPLGNTLAVVRKMLFVVLLIVVTIVLISPVRVWLDYRHQGLSEDALLVQSQVLWGAKTFALQVPVIATGKRGVSLQARSGKFSKRLKFEAPTSLSQLKQAKQLFQAAKPVMQRQFKLTRRFLRIERLISHTEVGINDSALLAQLVGSLWGIKGLVVGKAQSVFRFTNQPILRIKPRFNQSYFRTVFSCILVFPLGYIIIVALITAYLLLKLKLALKRGENKDVGTSNSRSHEDSHGKHQGNG